ncbi:MAG: hypothetical protein ACOYD3_02380 [Kiritimatiellia bacterium]|jgi:hypothetical protein
MKRHLQPISAVCLALASLVLMPAPLPAEEVNGPPWARSWDAVSRQVYLNGTDTDWDGLTDDEEAIGLVLWGAAGEADREWVADPGVGGITEWNWSGIDDDVQPVGIPFAFPWGGQNWTSIWVGVNGTLGFERGQPSPVPRPLPASSAGPYPFLGVFWQQLYLEPDAGGRVWTWAPADGRFVISWDNLWISNAVNSRISFQAELRHDGSMIWRYRDLDDGKGGMAQGMLGAQRDNLGWWTFSDNLNPGAALLLVPLHGVSATNADSDGDGIPDGVEFFYAHRPGSLPEHRLDPAQPDNPGDIDRDGLDVMMEFLYGRLDPFYWDSDGDMLGDGYEVVSRLLAYDATGIHGLMGDGDGDGLSNLMERLHRTQPRLADSDGDGWSDAYEIAAGANPAGAGGVSPPELLAPVNFMLGDPGLDGATEAYEMHIESISGDTRSFTFQNTAYGVVQTQTIRLAVGGRYRISINHLGSVRASQGFADPDYEARIEGADGTVLAIEDPHGILGTHLSGALIPPGIAPLDTSLTATIWIQSRVNPDGTTPVVDPALTTSVDAWAAGRATWVAEVPRAQLANPGVLVLPSYTAYFAGTVPPTKLRLHGIADNVPGLTRHVRFSDPARLLYKLPGMGGFAALPGAEIALPGATDDAAVDMELLVQGDWPAGTSVTVDYVLRGASGNVVAVQNRVRLIGIAVAAIGDSMTYGFRRRRDGTEETPRWGGPWLNYPSPQTWNNYYGNWYDIAFQGYRGYLRNDLTTAIPWVGHPANGHGPDHCGYPGSRPGNINGMLDDTSRPYPAGSFTTEPVELAVLYFIGINDLSRDRSASAIYADWKVGLDKILALRAGRGRTLIVAMTLTRIRSDYANYSPERDRQLRAFNNLVRAHTVNNPYTRFIVADIENVPHDSNDDGLHYMAPGYQRIEEIVRQAIFDGLRLAP